MSRCPEVPKLKLIALNKLNPECSFRIFTIGFLIHNFDRILYFNE